MAAWISKATWSADCDASKGTRWLPAATPAAPTTTSSGVVVGTAGTKVKVSVGVTFARATVPGATVVVSPASLV